jgi:uncharacterized protein
VTEIRAIDTAAGTGRWYIDKPVSGPVGRLVLGHGAGGGVGAHDLELLAGSLPDVGVEVCRFEQPWRCAGRKVAGPPSSLDRAWLEALPAVTQGSIPLVVGGRSAGARVACRTAAVTDATAVLTLAFPLHPPGRPERSRADELPVLPMLAVQGERDAFGGGIELGLHLGAQQQLLEIAGADHSLKVRGASPITQEEADEILVVATRRWLREQFS